MKFDIPSHCAEVVKKSAASDNKGNTYFVGRICNSVDLDPGPAVFAFNGGSGCANVLVKHNSAGGVEWAIATTGEANKLEIDPVSGDVIIMGYSYLARYNSLGSLIFTTNFTFLETLYDLTLDLNGNILVTGQRYNNMYLGKFTPAGVEIWSFALGPWSTANSSATAIITDLSGDIFITGSATSLTDLDPGPGVYYSPGGMLIMKYSSGGNFLFVKNIPVNTMFDNLRCYDMTLKSNGNIVLTGFIEGPSSFDFDPGPGISNLTSLGGRDIFLASYDMAGTYLWAFAVGSPGSGNSGHEEGLAITTDPAGNSYVTGTMSGTIDFDPGPGTFLVPGNGGAVYNREAFVAKYNSGGQFTWAFKIGPNVPSTTSDFLQIHGHSISLNFVNNIVVGLHFGTSHPSDFDPSSYVANFTNSGCIGYSIATYFQGKVWNGNSNVNWQDPANWSDGNPPGVNDFILLPSNGVVNNPSISVNTDIRNLQIQAGRTLSLNASNLNVTQQVRNKGTVVNNGTISAPDHFMNAGTYTGNGTYTGPLFYNATTTSDVVPGSSPGCLSFSNDFKTKGNIHLEINGTNPCIDFDRINVGGIATVGGTLHINWGMTPVIGQSFQIINAMGYAGSFERIVSTPSWGTIYNNGILTVNSPLPVNIISFTGLVRQDDIHLNWKTTDANNLKQFSIERSTDGIHFQSFETKPAINAAGEISYKAIDLNAKQFGNKLFYRLKTEELDGKIVYSKILVFQFEQKTSITQIYPNPSAGLFTLTVHATNDSPLSFSILDLYGRELQKHQFRKPGNYSLNLSGLPAGVYFIKTSMGEVFRLLIQQ